MTTFSHRFSILVIIVLGGSFSSCDNSFNPIAGNIVDSYSIFGYLDAGADTQWVRIMPIRATITSNLDSLDAKVMLYEEGGASTEMTPRMFNFSNIVGDSVIVWNYWTDFDIKPNTNYHLVVERPNGEQTTVTVRTPNGADSLTADGATVIIDGAPNLVDLRIKWTIRDNRTGEIESFSLTNYGSLRLRQDDYFRFEVRPNDNFLNIGKIMGYYESDEWYRASINGDIEVLKTQLVAISAGPDWIDFYDLTREEISIQSINESNIQNGVGYLVGAFSEEIPFEICKGDAGDMIVCHE